MPERIDKLQPNRTLHLRGFDGLGAGAALHSATAEGFRVSGVFRDASDFAVLILHDADNFYEHPRLKYLPDFSFGGLTLSFDVRTAGLMPLDSPLFPTIDWPYLDAVRQDGTTVRVRLFDHAVQAGGTYTAAAGEFTVVADGPQGFDRVTLWCLNRAFDYVAPADASGVTAAAVAQALASQINAADWSGATLPLAADAVGSTVRVRSQRPGQDGNRLTLYSLSKNSRLRTAESEVRLTGGSSAATWRVTLDFAALGLQQVRLLWLTFAPAVSFGQAYTATEWEAEFTQWAVSGPDATRRLQVAGPGSVRIEEDDPECRFTGTWSREVGFFSQGSAARADAVGTSVTIPYACAASHDLYVGTSLYGDRGVLGVRVDAGAETELDCRLANEPAVHTRRKVATGLPAGRHTVTLRLLRGQRAYFDFLEAVVASDVPDPAPAVTNLSPALDYSTDHTYKLSPARLLWSFDQLGYAGPMNEYLGVFWWNQRVREGGSLPQVTIPLPGPFAAGDELFLDIGGQRIGKSVFPADTPATIAAHFRHAVNATSVGVWAAVSGTDLALTAHSAAAAYRFAVRAWVESPAGTTTELTPANLTLTGEAGRWVVDPAQEPPLNRGARDWHADFFRECQRAGREVVVASSMELVNPPAGFAAEFPGGVPVTTDVGFGSHRSTHCAPITAVRLYQQRVFAHVAGLMAEAGLMPQVQLGEYLWWFFTSRRADNPGGGMAFYDPETSTAALAELGRPLHLFVGPNDDPHVNGSADAVFLRNRLRDHAAGIIAHVRGLYPTAQVELLFPYDVNHPTPAGMHQLGGRLNRFVNFPVEWGQKPTSGFDRLKMEALDFGAWSRNLDLAQTAIRFPIDLGWPLDSVRHLVPIFGIAYPWQKEYRMAVAEGIPAVNLWAFDHICLYGLDLDQLRPQRTVILME